MNVFAYDTITLEKSYIDTYKKNVLVVILMNMVLTVQPIKILLKNTSYHFVIRLKIILFLIKQINR